VRSITVLRHGHINQFANDYDHVLAMYRDVFDADVFMEFEEPDFGGKNAVYVAGAAAFEIFSPTKAGMAIAASIERFGERWHSLEWTVPDLDEAIAVITERGIRITDSSPGSYVFVHPRDCFGLCVEITPHYFENDPRDASGWDPTKGANSNPMGIIGGPTVTLCVPDADEAITWLSEFVNRERSMTHAGTASFSRAIDFGDHIIEFVTPTDQPQEAPLKLALQAHGASIYSVTLPVESLQHTQTTLQAHGFTAERVQGASTEMLVMDEAQTDGARLQFREQTHL
jgi:hypothetical protein